MALRALSAHGAEPTRLTEQMLGANSSAGASDACDAALSPRLLRAVTPPLSAHGCQSRTPSTGMSSPRQCRAPIRHQAVRLRANGRGLFRLQMEVSEAAHHEWIDAFEKSCEAEAESPDVALGARFWEPRPPAGPVFSTFKAVLPAQEDAAAVAVADARPAIGAARRPPPRLYGSEKAHPPSESAVESASCSVAWGVSTDASASGAKRPREPECPMDAEAPGLRRPHTPIPQEQETWASLFPPRRLAAATASA
mmetsp:Transcript_33084/g.107021  ORF Transcript_33084/g.107021 Transcript_33084/m.107021 type:complete len:253 (-) Transcript_33084:715-1473(-)